MDEHQQAKNVSRLDYFAAHAPAVPDWYSIPGSPFPPEPPEPANAVVSALYRNIRHTERDWPAHLTTIVIDGSDYAVTTANVEEAREAIAALEDWRERCEAVRDANRMARMTSWAAVYARRTIDAIGILGDFDGQ